MKKVIIINGRGGVGKDTLCDFAAKKYRVLNVSSITPIKEIAAQIGWHGEKSDKARKFLSELKQLTTDYNDYPTNCMLEKYDDFLDDDNELMFVHIRESDQIAHFIDRVRDRGGDALTLLVRRGEARPYGNPSDDNVENYPYDLIYQNDLPLEQAETDFVSFLKENL